MIKTEQLDAWESWLMSIRYRGVDELGMKDVELCHLAREALRPLLAEVRRLQTEVLQLRDEILERRQDEQ